MSRPTTKSDTNDRGRFSARRRTEAVRRLLRGEDLDDLSRELGVTAATLSAWRASFLDGNIAAMRSRPGRGDRPHQAKVGQLTMDVELLGQECQHLEASRPFAWGRRGG